MILEKAVDVTNRDSDDVLRYAYMNSYYQTGLRNVLDRSVLSHTDLDVERGCGKVDEIPFDFQRKRMSVVVDYEGTTCSSARARWKTFTRYARITRSMKKLI